MLGEEVGTSRGNVLGYARGEEVGSGRGNVMRCARGGGRDKWGECNGMW